MLGDSRSYYIAIKKNLQRIIVEIDSQLVVNTVHDKISSLRDIVNLIEHIRDICPFLALVIVLESVMEKLIK